ncbi:caspase family protein [Dongia sp.]|jgi:carboxyl-terminal processing protease|uniref:caspase family protein n=1 Tax=Dongia sp. TaxID=1977262 RepID=UPI0035B43992
MSTQRRVQSFICLLAGILLLAVLSAHARPALAEPRIALVIGNGKYGSNIGSLINPPNDAALMADRLSHLGFKVTKLVNGDQKAMKRAISAFGQQLTAAGPDAVGLFFYAGHGVQVDGANYLIPVGAAINAEADVDLEAVSAETVLKQMEFAGTRVNIVILDACRNNPLPRSMRSAGRGLARMDAPTGSFIGYSTAPGNVANDGDGKNSPYTTALAAEMAKPGIAIEEAFRNVRVKVMASTESQQVPWESSSLTGAFFFQPQGGAAPDVAAAPASAPSAVPSAKEKTYWDSVKDSKDASDFKAYLTRYPDGFYAEVAQDRIARYGSAAAVPQQSAERNTQAETQTPPAAAEPVTEPVTEVAALPPEPEPAQPSNAGGGLQLSAKVSGQLKAYLSKLQNRNGAFAVSPDGQFSGSFTCEEVAQCVPGKKGQRQNTDPRYPQNAALQKCAGVSKQECVIVLIRGDQKQPYSLASE